MNMEAMTDRAVESATDQAHDAYSVTGESPFIYDKESWADCIADIITDPANDELQRHDLRRALDWISATKEGAGSDLSVLIHAERITCWATEIGFRVIKNAIKNGVTLENIGKVD